MDRKSFIDNVATKLKAFDDELINIEQKIKEASGDVKEKLKANLEELRTKKEEANHKLIEVRAASEDVFTDLKTGAEKVYNDMQETFSSVSTRLFELGFGKKTGKDEKKK